METQTGTDATLSEPAEAVTSAADADSDALLAAYLREHASYCPRCRYNLHRLKHNRCPECGTSLVLGLYARYSLDWFWLIGLMLLAANAGFWLVELVSFFVSELLYATFSFYGDIPLFRIIWVTSCRSS